MSFSFFQSLPDDLRRAQDGQRRAEEAKRRLEARLGEEQGYTKKFMDLNKGLRERAKALLADTEATRRRIWDLKDENDRLRGDNQLLDAENNQLRDDNAKLQQVYRSGHCYPLSRLQEAEDREGEEAGAPEERAEARWPAHEAVRSKGGL